MWIKNSVFLLTLILIFTGCGDQRQNSQIVYYENDRSISGDVTGGPEKEEIIIEAGNLLVSSSCNSTLTRLPRGELIPALLFDLDGDKKLDIFFGTKSSSKPRIYVINGKGNIIQIFGSNDIKDDSGVFYPDKIIKDKLYVISTMGMDKNPRGIYVFSLKSNKLLWNVRMPANPTGLAFQYDEEGKEYISISHSTIFAMGGYRFFGKDDQLICLDEDALIHFYRIDGEGNIVNANILYSEQSGEFMKGAGYFYPTGPKHTDPVLLIHLEKGSYDTHLIDSLSGEITRSSAPSPIPENLIDETDILNQIRISRELPVKLNIDKRNY